MKHNNVISFCSELDIKVCRVIADAPKRAEMRCFKQFNAYYGCDVCTEKATRLGKGCVMVYPVRDVIRMADLRTHGDTAHIARNIEDFSLDERRGVKGPSPLLRLPGFDIIYSMLPEYMHQIALGVAEKLVQLCFALGSTRPKTDKKYRRLPADSLNKEIAKVRLPTEISRRSRGIEVGCYKAEEYRNLCLILFPLLIKHCEGRSDFVKLWTYLAFLTRAYVLPDDEYSHVSKGDLRVFRHRFLQRMQGTFGRRVMHYNTHIMLHLDTIRQEGNLADNSAFLFEKSFSLLRKDLAPTTPNPGKQVLGKMYESIESTHFTCRKQMRVRPHVTTKADDSYFYTFVGGTYLFYKCREESGTVSGTVLASRVVTRVSNLGLRTVRWESVGVYRKVCDVDDTEDVRKSLIAGKAVVCDDHIISLSRNVLDET